MYFFVTFFRTYSNFSNDQLTQQERDKLFASLSDEDKAAVDKNGPYFFAGYDPPSKVENRRNEIWLVRSEDAKSSGLFPSVAVAEKEQCSDGGN